MGQKKTTEIDSGAPEMKMDEAKAVVKKDQDTRKPKHGRGKKYKEARLKVDRDKHYSLEKAVELVRETSYTKFDGTVELHLRVRKQGASVSVSLPHQAGKKRKVEVASEETIKKLAGGKVDFDVLLATPEMMPKLVPFARVLGPKGLMPNPKNGTLIKNEAAAAKFDTDSITLKTEKNAPIMHMPVGKLSMENAKLIENIKAVFSAFGPKQIERVTLSATMGPGVKVQVVN